MIGKKLENQFHYRNKILIKKYEKNIFFVGEFLLTSHH